MSRLVYLYNRGKTHTPAPQGLGDKTDFNEPSLAHVVSGRVRSYRSRYARNHTLLKHCKIELLDPPVELPWGSGVTLELGHVEQAFTIKRTTGEDSEV